MIAEGFRDIKDFTALCVSRRNGPSVPSFLKPSGYWHYFIGHFSYLSNLGDQELRRIRYHTYHLTGDYYVSYTHQPSSTFARLRQEYLLLVAETGGYRAGEGEQGYGSDIDGEKVTVDTVRYLQVIADLTKAKAIDRTTPTRILEIGGGYGGLARSVMQFNPHCSYIICDLEETQFIQAIYLSVCFGFDAVELCPDGLPEEVPLKPGKFYLVPQHASGAIATRSIDLVVNQQSLQEMTTEQVMNYVAMIKRSARAFYSCNSQHNEEVTSSHGIVVQLQALLDAQFPVVQWQSRSPALGPNIRRVIKLGRLMVGRLARTVGDANLRRVLYDATVAAA